MAVREGDIVAFKDDGDSYFSYVVVVGDLSYYGAPLKVVGTWYDVLRARNEMRFDKPIRKGTTIHEGRIMGHSAILGNIYDNKDLVKQALAGGKEG